MSLNPFVPANPQEVARFMEGVQPKSPAVHEQIIDTAKQIGKAVAGTGVTIVTAPLALPEATLYGGANVLGAGSAVLNKMGSMINKTRTRAINVVLGA